jgi:hypothetical protein
MLMLFALLFARALGFVNRDSAEVLLAVVLILILLSSFSGGMNHGLQQCESPVSSDLRDPGRCGVLHGI